MLATMVFIENPPVRHQSVWLHLENPYVAAAHVVEIQQRLVRGEGDSVGPLEVVCHNGGAGTVRLTIPGGLRRSFVYGTACSIVASSISFRSLSTSSLLGLYSAFFTTPLANILLVQGTNPRRGLRYIVFREMCNN